MNSPFRSAPSLGLHEVQFLPHAPGSRGRIWRRGWLILPVTAIILGAVGLRLLHARPPIVNDLSAAPRVEGKHIVFSDAYAKSIGITTLEVGHEEVVPAFSVVGTATFDPAHVVRVGAMLRGIVREVRRFEGAQVKRGEVLAAVDSPELGEAQASVAMLSAENGAALMHRKRENLLAERQLTTARDVEEANANADRTVALLSAANQRVSALSGRRAGSTPSRALGVHVLTSPMNGTIIERHVSKGQWVDANHVAFLIADLDHLWVELSVFERTLPSIKVGDVVELHPEASGSGSDVVQGEVAQVGAVLNADTRGATLRVHVDNHARKFRPGQSVSATIRATAAAVDDVPTVPASAVTYVDGEPTVFLADSPTSVIATPVELGETNGQKVQIRTGIATGQRVVIRGTNELRNELFR
ncbi:MAG TPA: efflux RND transporter periplasmic adaptor subunit [Polyangiaceae bacterium]